MSRSPYIKLVPDRHIVNLLERQITESAAFLAAFTPEQALWREGAGGWNIVEIVRHLADVDRVFEHLAAHRAPTRSCVQQVPGRPHRL